MKTQYIPFIYKGWVSVVFYTKVIMSRNRMQNYETIPNYTVELLDSVII